MTNQVIPAIWWGLKRRCSHCGDGDLFVRWITLHARCLYCGLEYLRNQGEAWPFFFVMDRIPIAAGITAIFFGFRISHWIEGVAFFCAIAVPIVVTMPQRQGLAISLNYLSRVYFCDPSDLLP